MKEYIVAVEDDERDFEEVFIGHIRKQTELIRCKDCKYYRPFITNPDVFQYCRLWSKQFKEDEYCARAKRRGEE